MREIKFRGWNKALKEWEYFAFPESISGSSNYPLDLYEFWGQLLEEPDRYGRSIYEGDILDFDRKIIEDQTSEGQYTYAVKWSDCQWVMRYAPTQYPLFRSNAHNSVVIGNLYQNPELTKVFIQQWFEMLIKNQLQIISKLDEYFKLKLHTKDQTIDGVMEYCIDQLYQYDEGYIGALHEEFEDFPELIDEVWKGRDEA